MNFLNNNVNSKSYVKNTLSKKNLLITITILLSLTIITYLVLTTLSKKNITTIMHSTSKETVNNINLKQNSNLIGNKNIVFNTKLSDVSNKPVTKSNNQGFLSKIIRKDITVQPIYLFNMQLPFYRKININESPLLSFMSTIEVFYSISILLILAIIIAVLIIALLSRPVINLFSYLDVMGIFTRNKTKNNLSKELGIGSHDNITKNF